MMRYFLALVFCSVSRMSAAASTASAPLLGHSELVKILSSLLLVIVIIVLLSWVVKRLNVVQLGSSKGFESISTMTLGPKERMMVVKVGTRYLLIGIGASTVNTLYDFGEQLPDVFTQENKTSFAELLKSARRKS